MPRTRSQLRKPRDEASVISSDARNNKSVKKTNNKKAAEERENLIIEDDEVPSTSFSSVDSSASMRTRRRGLQLNSNRVENPRIQLKTKNRDLPDSGKQKSIIFSTNAQPESHPANPPGRRHDRKGNPIQNEEKFVHQKVSTSTLENEEPETPTVSNEEVTNSKNPPIRSSRSRSKKIKNEKSTSTSLKTPTSTVSSTNNRKRRTTTVIDDNVSSPDSSKSDVHMVLEIGESESSLKTASQIPSKRKKSCQLTPTKPSEVLKPKQIPSKSPQLVFSYPEPSQEVLKNTPSTPMLVFPSFSPRKKKSTILNENSSDSEIDVVDGVEEFQMPVFYVIPKSHILNPQKTENPLTLLDYMRRSTFMRIRVDERSFLERTFRAYLLAQFDSEVKKVESVALNSEDVKKRINEYHPDPIEDCFACEKTGKNVSKNPISSSMSNVETKPHMKYSNFEQGYGVDVDFHNPLYRKGIANLPDLRLIGHNVNKLIPAVAPKKKKPKRDPVAVHLCREYYGDFEYSTTSSFATSSKKKIRPLLFYKSYPSIELLRYQNLEIDRLLKRRHHSFFHRQPRKRRKSESPPYSRVPVVGPLGAFRPRLSRSLSPVRSRHSEVDSDPVAFKVPFQLNDSNFSTKFVFCSKINGSFLVSFWFSKTEQAILMPTRPKSNVGNSRFRKMDINGRNSKFHIFDFSVVEDRPLEYFLNLRFQNTVDISMIELRPETKSGAVLPRRMIYNFLRISLKKPKPITWQKKPKKSIMKSLQKSLEESWKHSNSTPTSSVRSVNVGRTKITVVDVFKWLGLYCVTVDENKAKFVLLEGYREEILIQDPVVSLFDLLRLFPKPIFKENNFEWIKKSDRIIELINDGHPVLSESRVLNTVLILIKNKKGFFSSNFQYFKSEPKLKLFEIFEINKALEKIYLKITKLRYSENSDADSQEYDTATDEDCDWEISSKIKTLGSPEPISSKNYSLGDFIIAKMRDPWKKDISNVIPPSKHLKEKFGERRIRQKRITVEGLLPVRRKTKWDESSSEDESDQKIEKNKESDQKIKKNKESDPKIKKNKITVDSNSSIQEIFEPTSSKTSEIPRNGFDEDLNDFNRDLSVPEILPEATPKKPSPSKKKVRFVFLDETREKSVDFDDEDFMEIITRPLEIDQEEESRNEKEGHSQSENNEKLGSQNEKEEDSQHENNEQLSSQNQKEEDSQHENNEQLGSQNENEEDSQHEKEKNSQHENSEQLGSQNEKEDSQSEKEEDSQHENSEQLGSQNENEEDSQHENNEQLSSQNEKEEDSQSKVEKVIDSQNEKETDSRKEINSHNENEISTISQDESEKEIDTQVEVEEFMDFQNEIGEKINLEKEIKEPMDSQNENKEKSNFQRKVEFQNQNEKLTDSQNENNKHIDSQHENEKDGNSHDEICKLMNSRSEIEKPKDSQNEKEKNSHDEIEKEVISQHEICKLIESHNEIEEPESQHGIETEEYSYNEIEKSTESQHEIEKEEYSHNENGKSTESQREIEESTESQHENEEEEYSHNENGKSTESRREIEEPESQHEIEKEEYSQNENGKSTESQRENAEEEYSHNEIEKSTESQGEIRKEKYSHNEIEKPESQREIQQELISQCSPDVGKITTLKIFKNKLSISKSRKLFSSALITKIRRRCISKNKRKKIKFDFKNVEKNKNFSSEKIQKELKERQQRTKRIYYCRNLLGIFDKPVAEVEEDLKKILRTESGLEEEWFLQKEPEAFWRVFGADLDEDLFEDFLKNMKFNYYFFLKSRHEFRKLLWPIFGFYEKLLFRKKIENEFIKKEIGKNRESSLEPNFERFQFSSMNPDPKNEADYNPEKKSPFDFYLKQFPSGSLQKIRKFRRSVSLPSRFDTELISKLESITALQNPVET